ncbi:ATP-binding protein [Streptomyces sp.]|uniref:ATP-binding protein n=1 Tax=Streptomyces sp. TaxID=1931 RepID=UPI002F4225AE
MDQRNGDPGERPDRTSEGFDPFGTGTGAGVGVGGSDAVGGGEGFDGFRGGAGSGRTHDTVGTGREGGADAFDGFGTGGTAGAVGAGNPSDEAGDQAAFDPFGARPASVGSSASSAAALVPLTPPQIVPLSDGTSPLPRVTARPPRDSVPAERGTPSGGTSRVRRIVAGDYLLTVNPVDGTEVTPCPPEERRTPVRRSEVDRAARIGAARPAPPPGPPAPELPLLERDEEKERLVRLLARGRSIRVTGPSGVGRTTLLEAVADACGDLAPDGVLWLSGYRRTAADLLQDLYATVYAGEDHRPDRADLPRLLRAIGAVVVLDDLEFGGSALEDLLATAPECAFLLSATPDVPAPSPDSMIEEVFLPGLTRAACVDLLQLAAGRRLEDDEPAWAADLWFESEGLPLRFVQAGALLRQRDVLRQPPEPDSDDSVWENGSPAAVRGASPEIPDLTGFDEPVPGAWSGAGSEAGAAYSAPTEPSAGAEYVPVPSPAPVLLPAAHVPLPSLAEGAAPANLLVSRLGEAAREALAFAVALDGECPHPSHLPALVGDAHGDAAMGELTSVGLALPVGSHFRLAAGVVQQLSATLAEDGELSDIQAHTAALHYTWWTGHPSVTPARAAAESEAIIAAMTACRDGGHASAAVLLARSVAPVFAAALHWGAWERALRVGQEAARLAGEVAEEAYFHHELGVLALCTGHTDRARAELEASIALRGALADRQGTVVGRRTLALINDRAGARPPALPAGASLPALPAGSGVPAATALALPEAALTVINKHPAGPTSSSGGGPGGVPAHRLVAVRSRRNLVAAGTGVLLAGVLGTIVTLGATSGGGDTPNRVQPIESGRQDGSGDITAPPEDGGATAPAAPASTTPSSTAPTTTTASAPGSTDGTTPPPDQPTTSPPGRITSPPGAPTTSPAGTTTTGGGGSTTPPPVTDTSKPPQTPSTSPTATAPTPTDTAPSSTTSPPTGPVTLPQSSSAGPSATPTTAAAAQTTSAETATTSPEPSPSTTPTAFAT